MGARESPAQVAMVGGGQKAEAGPWTRVVQGTGGDQPETRRPCEGSAAGLGATEQSERRVPAKGG
eukprot:10590435-Lingulodinium_polyedra.AAC.1